MWHKNRYFAEAVASSLVRFAAPGSSRHHRSPHSRRVFGQKRGITKGNAPRILNRPHKCKGGFQRCSRLVGRLGCCDLSTTTRGACGSNSFLNINLERTQSYGVLIRCHLGITHWATSNKNPNGLGTSCKLRLADYFLASRRYLPRKSHSLRSLAYF